MPLQTKEFEDIVTLSRPSPKWVWNKEGVLVEVPADQPAYNYDAFTGENLGLWVEDEETNGHTNGKLNEAVTGYTITDPSDPFMPDAKVLTDDVGHTGNIHTSLGEVYPFTSAGGERAALRVIYAKNDGKSRYVSLRTPSGPIGFTFDLQSGEVVPGSSSGSIEIVTEQKSGGWWQLSFSHPWGGSATGNAYVVSYGSSFSGTSITSEIGDQITIAYPSMYDTNSPTPGSIIPTDGSAVTRAADIPTIQNVDTAEWFNADAFTLYAEVIPRDVQNLAPAVVLGATAQDRVILFFQNGEAVAQVRGNQGITSISPAPAVQAGEAYKFAVSYQPGEAHIGFNGVVQTVVNELDETPTKVAFGSLLNGTFRSSLSIQNFRMYPRTLTAVELQDLIS